MNRLKRWLHDHNHHHLCQVVRVPDKRDYEPEWIVGIDPETGIERRVDITIFGGRVVTWKKVHR